MNPDIAKNIRAHLDRVGAETEGVFFGSIWFHGGLLLD
jgi:hypothetical protein